MTDDVHFPEYRPGSGLAGARALGFSSVGGVGIMAGLAQFARAGAPLWVLLGLPALLIVLYVLLLVAARRTATLTGPHDVVVQRPFGGSRTAWRDIQAIEIESNPGAIVDSGAVREFVVLYDRDGRRIFLPHVNSKAVFALREEVRDLRALWERLRGEEWTPLPEVTAKVARTRRGTERTASWMIGILVAAGAMVVTLLILLVLLLTGSLEGLDGPLAVLLSPPVIVVVPGVVCGVVVTVSLRRRRKERERSATIHRSANIQ